MTIPASSKFIQGQPERELGPGDLIVGLQGSENPKQLVLFDSEGLSFKTTGLTVSSSADINAIAVGARTFSLTADTLGLPVGTYFLRAYESRDGNNLVQEVINLSTRSVWIRSKLPASPASEWLDTDFFVETGGSGGGGGLSEDAARNLIGQLVFDWAEEGNTDLIPITKIPESLARLSQVENWAEVNNNTLIPREKLINAPQGGIFAEWSKDYHIDDSSLTMLEMGMTSSPSVALIDETVDGENTLGISISKGFSEFAFIPIQAILPRVIVWGVNSVPTAEEASLFANLPADDATEEDRTTHARAVKTFEDRIPFNHTKRIRAGTDEMGFPIDFCIYATKIMEVRDSSDEVTTPEGLDDIVIKFAGVNYPGFFDNIVVRLLKRVQQDSQTSPTTSISIDDAYTAIEITSPTEDAINNADPGVYTFQLTNPGILGLTGGSYLMRVYEQNINGFMGWVQEVIGVSGGRAYSRSNASGKPTGMFGQVARGGGETGTDGLTQSEVDDRIASWARVANEAGTTDIPEDAIPDTIARTSQLTSAGLDQDAVDARTVTSGSVAGTTLTLAKTGGDDVTITGLPEAGLNQGAVDDRIHALVENWAEIGGSNTQIPSGRIPVDNWVKTGNPALVPESKIPSEIARVSEIVPAIETAVPAWARDATTPVPTDKLPEVTPFTEDDARNVVLEWARTGDTGQIPNEKLDSREANSITAGVLLKLGSGAREFIDQGDVVFTQSWTGKEDITTYNGLLGAEAGVVPVAIDIGESESPQGDLDYESGGGLRGHIITFRGDANVGDVTNFQWLISATGEYFRQLTPGAQFQRVGKGVAYAWAEKGNLDRIPTSKLPIDYGSTHSELDVTYDFGSSDFSNVHELGGQSPDDSVVALNHIGNAVKDLRFHRVAGIEILAGECYLEFRARVTDGSGYTDPHPRRYTLTGLEKNRRYLAEELISHENDNEVEIDFTLQLRDNVDGNGNPIPGVRITMAGTHTNQQNPPVYGILLLEYARPVSNAYVHSWALAEDHHPIPASKLPEAHKAIPLSGTIDSDTLNNVGPGIFLFTLPLPLASLGLPHGTWILTSTQSQDGNVDLYQEAKRVGLVGADAEFVTYYRRKITGTWQNTDVFTEQQTGGSGTGLTPEQTAAIEANTAKRGAAIWAEDGDTSQIPTDKLLNSYGLQTLAIHYTTGTTSQLNEVEKGAYYVLLGRSLLGVPSGDYLLRAYERTNGSDIIQEMVNVTNQFRYTRTKGGGEWTDDDLFTGNTAYHIENIQSSEINTSEAGAFRFTVTAETLGLPVGQYFMRSYQLIGGTDIIQEAVRLGSNILYRRTQTSGEWTDSDLFVVESGVSGGSISGSTLTLTGASEDIVIDGIPTAPAEWAETGDTSTIPPEKLDISEVPDGGKERQVLAKASDADGDAEWVAPQGTVWSDNLLTAPLTATGVPVTIEELNENFVAVYVAFTNEDGAVTSSIIVREKSATTSEHITPDGEFSFPTANQIQLDIIGSPRGRLASDLTTVQVLRAVPEAIGSISPSVAAEIAANTSARAETWAREGDTSTIPPEKLPPDTSEPLVLADHYVHIGTPNLSGNDSGVVTGSTDITPGDTGTVQDFNVRFDNTLAGYSIPTAATYNPVNGDITLPAGHWIICASLNVVSTASTNSRVAAVLSINHGTNQRHAQALYLRNDQSQIGGDGISQVQGKVSVTGVVVSDGNNPIRIRIAVVKQIPNSGSSNNTTVSIQGAHIHGYQQLIGGSTPVPQWSANLLNGNNNRTPIITTDAFHNFRDLPEMVDARVVKVEADNGAAVNIISTDIIGRRSVMGSHKLYNGDVDLTFSFPQPGRIQLDSLPSGPDASANRIIGVYVYK